MYSLDHVLEMAQFIQSGKSVKIGTLTNVVDFNTFFNEDDRYYLCQFGINYGWSADLYDLNPLVTYSPCLYKKTKIRLSKALTRHIAMLEKRSSFSIPEYELVYLQHAKRLLAKYDSLITSADSTVQLWVSGDPKLIDKATTIFRSCLSPKDDQHEEGCNRQRTMPSHQSLWTVVFYVTKPNGEWISRFWGIFSGYGWWCETKHYGSGLTDGAKLQANKLATEWLKQKQVYCCPGAFRKAAHEWFIGWLDGAAPTARASMELEWFYGTPIAGRREEHIRRFWLDTYSRWYSSQKEDNNQFRKEALQEALNYAQEMPRWYATRKYTHFTIEEFDDHVALSGRYIAENMRIKLHPIRQPQPLKRWEHLQDGWED